MAYILYDTPRTTSSKMRSFAALSLATAALAFPSNIEERNLFPHPSIPNVAYMLDNDPNGCNIISFHIFQNGSIGEPLRTPTGGLGAMSYCRGLGCGNQGDLFPVDDLGSQGAVKVSGNVSHVRTQRARAPLLMRVR